MNATQSHDRDRGARLLHDHTLEDWISFHSQFFHCQIPRLPVLPELQQGQWPILIPQFLSIPHVKRICNDLFPLWIDGEDHYQTDLFITYHVRIPDQAYMVCTEAVVEAGNGFQKDQHLGMTLLERLVLELFFFDKTGNHLDNEAATLCSGSRYIDGGIPMVSWRHNRGLWVQWHPPDVLNNETTVRSISHFSHL